MEQFKRYFLNTNFLPPLELFKSVIPPENEIDPATIQDEDEMDDEDDDEVSQDDQGRILENCYLAMVDSLAKQVREYFFFSSFFF